MTEKTGTIPDFCVGEGTVPGCRNVETVLVAPAFTWVDAEHSSYPSSLMVTTWFPTATPGRVNGVTPIKLLSRKTFAPAGVDETESEPDPVTGASGWRNALTSETVFAATFTVVELLRLPLSRHRQCPGI